MFESFAVATMTRRHSLRNICVTNDHDMFRLWQSQSDPFLVHDLSPGFYRPFSRSWLITGFLPTPFSFMTYHRVSTDPFLVLDLSPGFYRPFPRSWFMTGFLTRVIRRMPLVVGELLNLISSDSPLFWGVRGAVVLLLLAILFYVILRFLTSYCPFVS